MPSQSPLLLALRNLKKPQEAPAMASDQLLEMILSQVTKMADVLSKDKDVNVQTQESHAP